MAMECVVRAILQRKPVAWFSPTYRTLDDSWRALRETLEPVTVRVSDSAHRAEIIGGGVLECWSLDSPDAGRGRNYASVVIDEAALVSELEHAWQQSIRPMLTHWSGEAWFLSTPRGMANYFHTLYQRGMDPTQEDWAAWRMPTSSNPFVPPGEVEIARRELTDLAFAQEYLAEFVSWVGAVFRGIADAAARPIMLEAATTIGVDWGRTGDMTVFVALTQRGHVVGLDRFTGIEYAVQRARLRAFWEQHGRRAWIIAETNSMGGPVVEQLQRDGFPVVGFWTSGPSKAAVIETLALAFERGQIAIPPDPVLMGELQAFEGKPTSTGMRYGAPSGVHDDCVMALAMAYAGLVMPHKETGYLDPRTGELTAEPREDQISPI